MKKNKLKEYPFYPSKFKSVKKRPCARGRVITLDTENIGLIPELREGDRTSGHVIVCKDKETDEHFVFFDPYEKRDPDNREWLDEWEGNQDGFLADGIKFINSADVIISQNWLGYDHLALDKIHTAELKVSYKAPPRGGKKRTKKYPFRVMDTLVMSQLLNPDRRPPPQAFAMERGNVSPHSIEAHGIRIGRYKPENDDWSKLTDHMITRCWEDVAIGDDFYDYLMNEWDEQSATVPMSGLDIRDAYRMEAVMYYESARQEQRGFRLDINYAFKLIKTLDKETKRILDEAMPYMPVRIMKKKINHEIMKKAAHKSGNMYLIGDCEHGSNRSTNWSYTNLNGNYSAGSKKDYPEHCAGNIHDHSNPVVCGPYTPVVWEQVSLGNRDVVRQTLYALGWRGVNLTDGETKYLEDEGKLPYKYAGKLDSDSIDRWKERVAKRNKKGKNCKRKEVPTWAIDILKYYIVTHRRSQIFNKKDFDYFLKNEEFPNNNGVRRCRGLVPRAVCSSSDKSFQELMELYGSDFWTKKQWDKDGEYRVPSIAFSIGTNTFRMRHKVVVNIPSRGLFGKEMRRLFIASKGYLIMGADASGLELRMLSHFMKDPEYEHILLHGDIHTFNQNKAGLPLRDIAKTFIYALLYGSGILGLSITCGLTVSKMQKVVKQFLTSLPKLDELIKSVQEVAKKRGHFVAADGRWGRVRKSGREVKVHTALNVLLQMTGSLCVKWGLYIAFQEFERRGIENRLLTIQHDEGQWEIPESEVKTISYKIPKENWKKEEENLMTDKKGRRYSAPVIVGEKKGKLIIERHFHIAGHVVCKSFAKAGKYLGIRTPLDGQYMIGKSWEQTH